MDLFIGLEKKEEQQSWYQSGLKPLDLWGFSAIAGGLFESAIYQLRPNQNQASAFHMQNLTFASSQLDLLKLDWSKKNLRGCLLRICLQICAARRGQAAGRGSWSMCSRRGPGPRGTGGRGFRVTWKDAQWPDERNGQCAGVNWHLVWRSEWILLLLMQSEV